MHIIAQSFRDFYPGNGKFINFSAKNRCSFCFGSRTGIVQERISCKRVRRRE